jgi:hypothetical protein
VVGRRAPGKPDRRQALAVAAPAALRPAICAGGLPSELLAALHGLCAREPLALDVKIILTPPCIFH